MHSLSGMCACPYACLRPPFAHCCCHLWNLFSKFHKQWLPGNVAMLHCSRSLVSGSYGCKVRGQAMELGMMQRPEWSAEEWLWCSWAEWHPNRLGQSFLTAYCTDVEVCALSLRHLAPIGVLTGHMACAESVSFNGPFQPVSTDSRVLLGSLLPLLPL